MAEENGVFDDMDRKHMRTALELAKNGQGRVAPNPPVGCVLVKEGKVVGQGWHDRLGDLHAETAALKNAGGAAARGAAAYVTMSPCTKSGRQPPCLDALLKAGVGEVVVAAADPNPANADGVEKLRAAGVKVRTGLFADEARYVAKGFYKMQECGRPWLTLKYAMTLDGRIAAAGGDSRWVSGEKSRELVMDLRSRADAILIGSGTAAFDNPQLTVRGEAWLARGGAKGHRAPFRVVVDGALRLAPGLALFKSIQTGVNPDVGAGGVVLACTERRNTAAEEVFRAAGVQVLPLPAGPEGRVSLPALLVELGKMGVNEIVCEGGAGLAAGLFAAGLVDEVVVFIAPKLIGGAAARGPVGGVGAETMSGALPVRVREWFQVGDDIVVKGLVAGTLG